MLTRPEFLLNAKTSFSRVPAHTNHQPDSNSVWIRMMHLMSKKCVELYQQASSTQPLLPNQSSNLIFAARKQPLSMSVHLWIFCWNYCKYMISKTVRILRTTLIMWRLLTCACVALHQWVKFTGVSTILTSTLHLIERKKCNKNLGTSCHSHTVQLKVVYVFFIPSEKNNCLSFFTNAQWPVKQHWSCWLTDD